MRADVKFRLVFSYGDTSMTCFTNHKCAAPIPMLEGNFVIANWYENGFLSDS